jgi:hypothetical protein
MHYAQRPPPLNNPITPLDSHPNARPTRRGLCKPPDSSSSKIFNTLINDPLHDGIVEKEGQHGFRLPQCIFPEQMIEKFPATFSTPFGEFWKNACMTLEKAKESHELRDAFQFLLAWRGYFASMHGNLTALSHRSNPDDPPDVMAHFQNRDVAIEITTIDPSHIRQSDNLHAEVGKGLGRFTIPLSKRPASRHEALNMMYGPGTPPSEYIADRNRVWFDSICSRVDRKLNGSFLQKFPSGILLLPGQINGSYGEDVAVQQAFQTIRASNPGAHEWTLAVFYQWNDLQYFSAIDAPGLGFQIQCV